jgi:hypothetical protein
MFILRLTNERMNDKMVSGDGMVYGGRRSMGGGVGQRAVQCSE